MNSTNAKRLFLILRIVVFLLGALMVIARIKYGAEIILVGIVLLGLRLIPPIFRSVFYDTNENLNKNFPNITQSIGITLLGVLIGLLITIKVKPGLNELIGKEASLLIYYLLVNGITFGIAYLIRKQITHKNSFNFTIENKPIIPFIIIGSFVLIFGIATPIQSLIPLTESFKKGLMEFHSQTGILTFLLMVIAAPIFEELIFRGIILDGLLKRYSPLVSILISSLLFGFAHVNPWQFILGLIIGLFFGWVYYKTRSVLPSIIMHASVNLCGYLLRNFVDINSHINDSLVKIYGGVTNLILSIIGSVIIVSICIYFLIKEFEKENMKLMTQRKI
jgi:membrane protease YdiL (CAAX protease family)